MIKLYYFETSYEQKSSGGCKKCVLKNFTKFAGKNICVRASF